MFPLIYMLVLMVNECSICIYNGTKEFTSIGNVLPLIETQLWYIQISTIYHPFLRDSIGNTIIQCTEYITLDVYCKAQKSLPQNSKYWGVQIQDSAWKCYASHEHAIKDPYCVSSSFPYLHSPIFGILR